MLSKITRFISYIFAMFVAFMGLSMLFIANVHNFWSFLVLIIGAIILLPPIQSPKVNILIYWLFGVIFLFAGIIIGAGTEEQVAKKQAAEQQKAMEKAQKQQEKQAKNEQAAKEKAERDRQARIEKAERDRQARIEKETSEVMLISKCQFAVQPTLKNPKSMQIDFQKSKKGTLDDGLGVNLYYYATNSFGAEILNMSQCKFTKTGELIEVTHSQ